MIWRVRGRDAFRGLARGARLRKGVLSVAHLQESLDGPPRIAFAVPRSVGGAVVRNRVRRLMRTALRANARLLTPGRAYLVSVRSGAESLTYGEIETTLQELLVRSAEQSP